MEITKEWIAEQRQISEIVDMACEYAPGSVVPLLKQIEKSQTAAIDALEAAYVEIARLTAERDAAVSDLYHMASVSSGADCARETRPPAQKVRKNMPEYIEREILFNTLQLAAKASDAMGRHDSAGIYASAASLVAEQPAADVAPVHRGEWVEFDGEGTYQCTYCGEPFMLMEGTPRDNEYNYCPKCGAYLSEGLDGGEHHAD